MVATIEIAGRSIGGDRPGFVIAEAGVNHNGDVERALQLIDVAAAAGADAVKFQTFVASRLANHDAPKAAYQKDGTEPGETQQEMLRRLELDEQTHRVLIAHCAARGIMFLSTPFDETSADLLESLGVAAFKIPSGELTNLPFLANVAAKRRPMIVSTGMATLDEVAAAVTTIRDAGGPPLALMHCVSAYPAAVSDCNLRAIGTLQKVFGIPVGWSDHTLDNTIAFAAVALGARIVEKHFTLDRNLPGPDHAVSLEPSELGELVSGIRAVESALGDGEKRPTRDELEMAAVARKSIVAIRDIVEGGIVEAADVSALRPGTGLSPAMLPQIVGRRTRRAVRRGELLSLDHLI